MPERLDSAQPDFAERFQTLLTSRAPSAGTSEAVAEIIADIRRDGDQALADHTRRLDRFDASPEALRVTEEELAEAEASITPKVADALAFARDRIEAHHRRMFPRDGRYFDDRGVELGWHWTPIDAVGLYVPGGTAAYPSSVLMNAVPATIAGVGRIVMAVPAPDGALNPLVLAAAKLCGVTEIYRIGGAQAIAALAYGTETIPPVDKIVGPGNAYVAEAKRQVFGVVGIDSIAGPSEVLIIAEGDSNPDWIAADLLAQAEHDVAAQSVLITPSAALAEAVEAAVARQLEMLPRAEIAAASWRDHGAIILVKDLDEAGALANRIAAEHVELHVAAPEALALAITNAGALFLGPHTPEAIGDYVGGSNHVLPTARSARFASGLSVVDFMKKSSLLRCGPDQLRELGEAAITLAEAEGLDAHARSVKMRLNL